MLFNITLYSSLPFISAVILVAYPFVSAKILSKIASFWISFILKLLRFLCGLDWEVKGLSNIPNSPVIVISNHQGQWESLYLQTLIHPISSIIKQELLLIPFFGWALAFMRPIPINRKNKFQSLRKVIDEASKRLNDGSSVLIFPEGTRIKPENGIAEFSNSCGLLSVKNNIPILPICHNSGKFWENKKFIKKRGLINVRIGPLFKGDDPKVLTNKVKAWMEKEYQKI
ncbi:MAG: lysophospholipid acyltransferase family protein [SAR86 cluster bacterium]|nr:lysophospholipid acyltransferase family protein [SAR86 cluster bacterium]